MRDFFNILHEQRYYRVENHNRSEMIYNFPETGSYIEFFSADDPAKMRGARRDVLFINECNNVPYSAFDQLEVRTKHLVILDYNPVSEFWVHTEVIPRMEHDFLKLTYLDNEALDPQIRTSIESRQHNENWWRIYGLGEIGVKEGQIYSEWKPILSIPDSARLIRSWIDFGYTNDPTAGGDLYEWNNAFIIDEFLYQPGLSNLQIANAIRVQRRLEPVQENNRYVGETQILTIADSAEPKSIDEIKKYGVKILGSTKGQDSVNYGIQLVQDQEIYYTERSVNIQKEQRNYLWKIDKDGKPLNVPEDQFNHHMDGIRYDIMDVKGRKPVRTFANKPSGF